MNTKLRLLVDEDIEDSVAESLSTLTAFNTTFVRDMPDLKGKSDKEVMKHAIAQNRIVLTRDGHFNRCNFVICTHNGIIRIGTKCTHTSVTEEAIRKFAQCGKRSKAKHAITILGQDYCMIETKDGIVRHRYK